MIDLDKLFEDAKKEKESILAELAPLRKEEEKLVSQLTPIEEKLREVREKIVGIERKRNLAEVSRTIARLLPTGPGVRSLKAETGHYKKGK